jgi:hypothetical protein
VEDDRIKTFAMVPCTDKKENQIFLIYKEIQNGAVAKSYSSLITKASDALKEKQYPPQGQSQQRTLYYFFRSTEKFQLLLVDLWSIHL